MGKREREILKSELEKLGSIPGPDETPEYYRQNQRVADAEKNVNLLENLYVRGQVD